MSVQMQEDISYGARVVARSEAGASLLQYEMVISVLGGMSRTAMSWTEKDSVCQLKEVFGPQLRDKMGFKKII